MTFLFFAFSKILYKEKGFPKAAYRFERKEAAAPLTGASRGLGSDRPRFRVPVFLIHFPRASFMLVSLVAAPRAQISIK